MRSSYLLHVLLVLLCFSACKEKPADSNNNQQVETPAAFEENNKIGISRYSRASDDLVDELYEDLADKDTELKDFNKKYDEYSEKPKDLRRVFSDYDDKSSRYYNTAEYKSQTIQDSALKTEILNLIRTSQANYTGKISNLVALMKKIDKNNSDLTGYYNALKLVRTLPLLEKYQQSNLPDEKAYRELIKEQEQLLKELKDLRK